MSKLRMLKFVGFGACAVAAYPWWTELVWETFGKAPEIAHAVTLASLATYAAIALAMAVAIIRDVLAGDHAVVMGGQ